MHTDDTSGVQIRSSKTSCDDLPLFSAEGAMKNIAFGGFAGVVSEIFEYPFDLAKVRLQAQLLSSESPSQLRFNGPIDCLKKTWKDEGVRGLYRGLPAPIVGSMAETAALFLAYSSFQNIIRSYSGSPRDYHGRPATLSVPQLGLAAAGAGFVTSFILFTDPACLIYPSTPIELVKCKMQVQMMNMPPPPIYAHHRPVSAIIPPIRFLPWPTFSPSQVQHLKFFSNAHHTLISNSASMALESRRPPGPFSIIRSTVQTYGVRGLWLGHTGTLLRETGGTAAWFAIKELVAGALRDRRASNAPRTSVLSEFEPESTSTYAEDPIDLLPWESALSGAIAGAACVLAFYPADTVKSAMQTEGELCLPRATSLSMHTNTSSAKAITSSFAGTLRRMYSVHGFRGLYAGCGMTVARAVPSSGIVFVVYDGLSAWLG